MSRVVQFRAHKGDIPIKNTRIASAAPIAIFGLALS